MKVLMFGWEFPPNISGGLGTACYGITNALSAYPDIDLTFVVPKAYGDEPSEGMKLIGANEIDLIKSKINVESLWGPYTFMSIKSGILPYIDPEDYKKICKLRERTEKSETNTPITSVEFTGKYGADLMTEIYNFSIVAEYIAKQGNYDIIHAHDWLTFPAGMRAKKITGKPLIVHVHATDFDRSGGLANPEVYEIEKAGMEAANGIITVSHHTAKSVKEKYGIDSSKIFTVHNGVEQFEILKRKRKPTQNKKYQVTFLGRITMQKGPKFFIDMAQKLLTRIKNVEFVMAGSGDQLKSMQEIVKRLGMWENFIFPGFLNGKQIGQILNSSDVFIMPSVSEPFGIVPLEAMLSNVPVIISKQSGVSELLNHAIKIDYWDTDAMADAVYSILTRPVLKNRLIKMGGIEVRNIKWENTAVKIVRIYDHFTRIKIA